MVFKKELELDSKEFTPHQDIISDDDFLILKPLNIISSRKYGASTKWCTSSSNPETFYDYSYFATFTRYTLPTFPDVMRMVSYRAMGSVQMLIKLNWNRCISA